MWTLRRWRGSSGRRRAARPATPRTGPCPGRRTGSVPQGGDPVDLYLYRDEGGPRPHLIFGSVASVGVDPVDHPEVVVGWLSPAGRLVGLVTTPVTGPDGGPLAVLAAGEAADALVVAEVAPPAGAEVLVWAQGS